MTTEQRIDTGTSQFDWLEFDLAIGWILIDTITNMSAIYSAYRSCCSEWINEELFGELQNGY